MDLTNILKLMISGKKFKCNIYNNKFISIQDIINVISYLYCEQNNQKYNIEEIEETKKYLCDEYYNYYSLNW